MSIIFDRLVEHASELQQVLDNRLTPSNETHPFPWQNVVYEGNNVRRAHLDVVDKREEKKLFMMHLCVFPDVSSSFPIYGFDLIAGPNKVTGAFHDLSPGSDPNHAMLSWFKSTVIGYEWSKPRELPDWAKQIFSGSMIAAGNIRTEQELNEVLNTSLFTLNYFLHRLESDKLSSEINSVDAQNKYCYYQKQNPHTPRVMQSLGFDEDTVNEFIQTCLFPEIENGYIQAT